ncbi:hypothetical protein PIB30_020787 [Stylosanthes scabra]|uniref:Cellulose synthase n=1 Tax=Stylosanthes scabra TaxID=79078 RepID=A0ABU6R900_9FABA|nr:hypothetical protein [Stylosanthes scabra]
MAKIKVIFRRLAKYSSLRDEYLQNEPVVGIEYETQLQKTLLPREHDVANLDYPNIAATEPILSNGMRICYNCTGFLDHQDIHMEACLSSQMAIFSLALWICMRTRELILVPRLGHTGEFFSGDFSATDLETALQVSVCDMAGTYSECPVWFSVYGNEWGALEQRVFTLLERRGSLGATVELFLGDVKVTGLTVVTAPDVIIVLGCIHYTLGVMPFPDLALTWDACLCSGRFDGIDTHDRYANRNTVFFDINMKGLDGIQGPVYVGTGCVFRRQALYGYNPPKGPKRPKMVSCDCCPCFGKRNKAKHAKNDAIAEAANLKPMEDDKELLMSQMNFQKKFGQSSIFVTSTLMEDGGVPPSSSPARQLKEAIHVISCVYEDKTKWGIELGWIYGSITEDILTGFKMHCCGWRSIYCMPRRTAFKGTAPINLSDRFLTRCFVGRLNPLRSSSVTIARYGMATRKGS